MNLFVICQCALTAPKLQNTTRAPSRHMIYIKNVLENLKTSTYVMHYYYTYFYDIVHRMLLGRKKYFVKNEIPYRNFETTK